MGGSLDGGGIMGCGADLDRLSMTTATDPLANAATTSTIIGAFAGTIITTTTTGNSQTLASPTDTTAGKVFTVVNNDTSTNTVPVVANSVTYTIAVGSGQSFVWDGSKWMPTSMGITSLPVIVTQGGTGLATITDHGIMLGSGTGAVTPMGALTNGQLVKGVTGADPTASTTTLTDGSNTYTLACGTGSLVVETGNSIVNQDLTTDASPTFGGLTKVGGASDYLTIGATGLVTMAGGAVGKLQIRPNIVQKQTKVVNNVPTEIYRGGNVGYSFPVWNSDNEELYFRMRIPNRWDGTTDPQFVICTTLMNVGGEDVGDKFKFQLEWQTSAAGNVMGTTTSNCVSEQTVLTGRADQYDTYFLFFTLDASDVTNPINAGEMLQGRLRQIAASSSAVTGEIGVWDWAVIWAVNKMYPVWSVDSNAT